MDIMGLAREWASNQSIKQNLREEIQKLINEADQSSENQAYKELKERFYKDLEFGTGGLRSKLGAGLNRVNEVTISRAAWALSQVILSETKNNPEKRSVAISYDSRQFSKEFSRIVVEVFAAYGIKTYLMDDMNPVPVLSYSIRYHKAIAGAMITASHNPPDYNGFKVYWDDGAQVTPPQDKQIIDTYYSLKNISDIKRLPFTEAESKGLVEWVGEKFLNDYHQKIKAASLNPALTEKEGAKLGVVYTPIHGSALKRAQQALKEYGFTNTHIVKEQAEPNGLFPTVKSPNPENKEALAMAVELMKKQNADVVFGSDPDGDRLGIAVAHKGEVIYPTGNQIGLLMLDYILKNLKANNKLRPDAYFIKTIVTTPLQEKVAKSYGIDVHNTLTGFKWICGKMRAIESKNPNAQFVFATEESFGYLNHNNSRDKDGISSMVLMAEIALDLKLKGKTLIDGLDDIYQKYAFSHEDLLSLDYFGIEGAEKIKRIMAWFRNHQDNTLFEQPLSFKEDYKLQQRSFYKGEGQESLADLPTSDVLGFIFNNEDRLFLRPSGTEPKIKFYIMINENDGNLAEKKKKSYERATFIRKSIEALAEKL